MPGLLTEMNDQSVVKSLIRSRAGSAKYPPIKRVYSVHGVRCRRSQPFGLARKAEPCSLPKWGHFSKLALQQATLAAAKRGRAQRTQLYNYHCH